MRMKTLLITLAVIGWVLMPAVIQPARALAQDDSGGGSAQVEQLDGGTGAGADGGAGAAGEGDQGGDQAQGGDGQDGTGGGGPGSSYLQLLIMVGGFFLLYFWMTRGRRKQQQQRKEMLANLKKVDKVTTIGGIVGRVVDVREDEVTVKTDESQNVRMKFARWAVRGVGEAGKAENPDEAAKDDKSDKKT